MLRRDPARIKLQEWWCRKSLFNPGGWRLTPALILERERTSNGPEVRKYSCKGYGADEKSSFFWGGGQTVQILQLSLSSLAVSASTPRVSWLSPLPLGSYRLELPESPLPLLRPDIGLLEVMFHNKT